MKTYLICGFLSIASLGFAQVGIHTATPQAQLDITAGTTLSEKDGILIPRIDEFPTTMTSAQDGMLAFLTGNGIPEKGFYYYNHGTGWLPIDTRNTLNQAYNEGGAGAGKNIVANDGAVRINGEDGLLVTGTFGSGEPIDTEITGTGTRLFFNPYKAAFRAGFIDGDDWDDAEIGNYSFASGYDTRAEGIGATAMGYDTSARGDYSFAIGKNVNAFAPTSFVMGENSFSIAAATHSFTLGFSAEARNAYTFSFGNNTDANGVYSFAFGDDVAAQSFGEIAMGLNNTNYTPNSRTAWDAADRLFVLGNGMSAASGSDAFIVYKDGRVEINQAYELPNTDGTTGYVLTTDGSGQVSWQESAMPSKSLVKATLLNNQSLTTGGWQKLVFSNEQFDVTNEYTPTLTSRFDAATDGFYRINAQWYSLLTYTNSQPYGIAIYVDGTLQKENTYSHHVSGKIVRSIEGVFNLSAGQFVEIFVYNTFSGVIVDAATARTTFEVEKLQ